MRELQAEGEQIVAAALEAARQQWRDRLVSAFALGSLAHGGFSAVSDIDVGFLFGDPLLASDADGVNKLAASIKESGRPFADRLSVFWGSVDSLSHGSPSGRFPPVDRLDLIKYGRLLAGTDVRGKLKTPGRDELVIAGAEFALSRLGNREVMEKISNARSLASSDAKTLTKLILYPVRFMFTAETGDVGRNDAAVEHYVARANGPQAELVRLALGWRHRGPPPGDPGAVQAISAGALPLYDDFLSDHERRLRHCGRQDLAEAFGRWRHELRSIRA
ncbi:MAG TPA: hypothetical protein VGF58_00780 [Burkholderiales bacterium]